MTAKRTQRPLKPNIIILDILVLHEILVLLIYTVVGQVHELVGFCRFC